MLHSRENSMVSIEDPLVKSEMVYPSVGLIPIKGKPISTNNAINRENGALLRMTKR